MARHVIPPGKGAGEAAKRQLSTTTPLRWLQIEVLPLPASIDMLLSIKGPTNVDIFFHWFVDPLAGYYRVYSTPDKTLIPPREGRGDLRCDTLDPTPSCIHYDGITEADSPLFYEVVGVCDGESIDVEGPN